MPLWIGKSSVFYLFVQAGTGSFLFCLAFPPHFRIYWSPEQEREVG